MMYFTQPKNAPAIRADVFHVAPYEWLALSSKFKWIKPRPDELEAPPTAAKGDDNIWRAGHSRVTFSSFPSFEGDFLDLADLPSGRLPLRVAFLYSRRRELAGS
jgi:hypothetical protein